MSSVPLAHGEFRSIAWGGAQVERFHVVARRGEGNDAVIWSPDQPGTCSLGPVAWYDTIQPLRSGGPAWGVLGKGAVAYIDSFDENKRGTLRFAGIDCRPLPLEISDVKLAELWTAYDPSYVAPRYAARTSDRRLVLGDPWTGEKLELARDVDGALVVAEGMWIVEGGQAVLRDLSGNQLARTGHDISELFASGEHEITYVDAGSIMRFNRDQGVTRVAEDACSATPLNGFPPHTLAYFHPCSSRSLVVGGAKLKPRTIADAVDDFISANGWLLYTVKGESSTTLWLSEGDGKGTQLAEADGFKLDRLWSSGVHELVTTIRESDDSLTLWRIDSARGRAASFEQGLVFAHSIEGDLLSLDRDGVLRLRPLSALQHDGTLATHVPKSSVRMMFVDTEPAVGFLADVDPDTGLGVLRLHFLHSGASYSVARGVRELREVWWPETGVVYTTGADTQGKGEGLSFAEISVPCSTTADSPWACVL